MQLPWLLQGKVPHRVPAWSLGVGCPQPHPGGTRHWPGGCRDAVQTHTGQDKALTPLRPTDILTPATGPPPSPRHHLRSPWGQEEAKVRSQRGMRAAASDHPPSQH